MFALLLAFILYTASIGSLSKYKAFLFGPLNSSSPSASASTTSGVQGEGVSPQTEAAIQQQVNQAANGGSGLNSDLQMAGEAASIAAMFL
jgi:hypothetical protein